MSPLFSFFGALGAICATIWGADAVRRVASYGLGTGVPSIGLLALGMGIVAALFGLSVGRSSQALLSHSLSHALSELLSVSC